MIEKIIRGINFILLTASIGMNILFLNLVIYLYSDMNSKIIYDIDRVRRQYQTNVDYYIHNACIHGTEYPEEYKEQARQGYFEKGPGFYCDELKNEYEEQIINEMFALGKANP